MSSLMFMNLSLFLCARHRIMCHSLRSAFTGWDDKKTIVCEDYIQVVQKSIVVRSISRSRRRTSFARACSLLIDRSIDWRTTHSRSILSRSRVLVSPFQRTSLGSRTTKSLRSWRMTALSCISKVASFMSMFIHLHAPKRCASNGERSSNDA